MSPFRLMAVIASSTADVTTKLGGKQHQVTVGPMVTSSLETFCINGRHTFDWDSIHPILEVTVRWDEGLGDIQPWTQTYYRQMYSLSTQVSPPNGSEQLHCCTAVPFTSTT